MLQVEVSLRNTGKSLGAAVVAFLSLARCFARTVCFRIESRRFRITALGSRAACVVGLVANLAESRSLFVSSRCCQNNTGDKWKRACCLGSCRTDEVKCEKKRFGVEIAV